MQCKCGYEGDPEYGDWHDKELLARTHIRCPKCKRTACIIVMPWERVKEAILYPENCYGSVDYGKHEAVEKVVQVGANSFSIVCPKCQWGEGGGMLEDKAVELRKLLLQKLESS